MKHKEHALTCIQEHAIIHAHACVTGRCGCCHSDMFFMMTHHMYMLGFGEDLTPLDLHVHVVHVWDEYATPHTCRVIFQLAIQLVHARTALPLRISCSIQTPPCSMHHATSTMPHTASRIQHARTCPLLNLIAASTLFSWNV